MDNTSQKGNIIPGKDDKTDFDRLFRLYYPRLVAYGCLFLEQQTAEDIVQELFVCLWENSKRIIIHTSLEAYLFKSVYLRCLNVIKQRKTRDRHRQLIEESILASELRQFDPDGNESIRKLYSQDLENDLRTVIDTLPPKCRAVFKLSYLYEIKNKEISHILDISLSTVENHLYNALKVLRLKLKKLGYFKLLLW